MRTKFFPGDSVNKFFKNYADAKEKCYELNEKILHIDRKKEINNSIKEKGENLKNYTALLRGYGENPFFNLLTQNTEKNKKIFDSLKFRAKIDDYKRKIKYCLTAIKCEIQNFIKREYLSMSYDFFRCKLRIIKNYDFKNSKLTNPKKIFLTI